MTAPTTQSAPTLSPADLSPAGPKRQQRGIQLPQLLLSLLVVAVFALLAVWWQASTTSRAPVLALATDIVQGEPVDASNFTEIFISTDVPAKVVPASALSNFLGARPVTNLSAGTLVTTEMFVVGAELLPGEAFVGLVLDGTRAPSGIVPGDRVQVLLTEPGGGVETLAPDARVESATSSGGELRIRLRLGVTNAQRAQTQADRVVLIEVNSDGLAEWEKEEDPS